MLRSFTHTVVAAALATVFVVTSAAAIPPHGPFTIGAKSYVNSWVCEEAAADRFLAEAPWNIPIATDILFKKCPRFSGFVTVTGLYSEVIDVEGDPARFVRATLSGGASVLVFAWGHLSVVLYSDGTPALPEKQ